MNAHLKHGDPSGACSGVEKPTDEIIEKEFDFEDLNDEQIEDIQFTEDIESTEEETAEEETAEEETAEEETAEEETAEEETAEEETAEEPKSGSPPNIAVVLPPSEDVTYVGYLEYSSSQGVQPVILTEIFEGVTDENTWTDKHGTAYSIIPISLDIDSQSYKFKGDALGLVSTIDEEFSATVSVDGWKVYSAGGRIAEPEDYSMVYVLIGIGIAIGIATLFIILALTKKRYFRCDSCNEGAWRIKEENSDGKKIIELHENHDLHYMKKHEYEEHDNEKKLYRHINKK